MDVRDALATGLARFREDAARWVRPQQVAELAEVTPMTTLRLLGRHPPLRAMAWFRLGSAAKAAGLPGVPGWVQRRLLRLYGLELSPGAPVGGGLYIAHPVGCTLQAARIGRNVTVIAAATFGYRKEAVWPTIGDAVMIGAGARVLGDVHLGEGCVIGANAVVTESVPAGSTAVGVPARVVVRPAPA